LAHSAGFVDLHPRIQWAKNFLLSPQRRQAAGASQTEKAAPVQNLHGP
jgi:hypothetical protein